MRYSGRMSRKPYNTDVNDPEWTIIEPLIAAVQQGGRPRSVNMREIINAIFYIQRSGWEKALYYRTSFHRGKQCTTNARSWRMAHV